MSKQVQAWADRNNLIFPKGDFAIYGQVYATPDHADQVASIYRDISAETRTEEGVLYYCIGVDQKDPTIFHFFERFASKEAFDRHNDRPITKNLLASGWILDVKANIVKPLGSFDLSSILS